MQKRRQILNREFIPFSGFAFCRPAAAQYKKIGKPVFPALQ